MSKTSVDGLRNSMYEQYRHELDGLWRNSSFAWTFEGLIFAAYSVMAKEFWNSCDSELHSYFVISALALLGLCTSATWIALAKASKTWQEWYEDKIVRLESDRDLFPYPREFAMGGSENILPNVDDSLRTGSSGRFSPGRINIFISQFVWFIWLVLLVAQQYFSMRYESSALVVGVASVTFYLVFIAILKKKTRNRYIDSEDYGRSYILDTYVRIERSEKHLADVFWTLDKDELYDYAINDYSGLSWRLFKIWEAQGMFDGFDDWCAGSFGHLKSEFCMKYINGELASRATCEEMLNLFSKELGAQKEKLRELYGKK